LQVEDREAELSETGLSGPQGLKPAFLLALSATAERVAERFGFWLCLEGVRLQPRRKCHKISGFSRWGQPRPTTRPFPQPL